MNQAGFGLADVRPPPPSHHGIEIAVVVIGVVLVVAAIVMVALLRSRRLSRSGELPLPPPSAAAPHIPLAADSTLDQPANPSEPPPEPPVDPRDSES